jgi:hypothetical protein
MNPQWTSESGVAFGSGIKWNIFPLTIAGRHLHYHSLKSSERTDKSSKSSQDEMDTEFGKQGSTAKHQASCHRGRGPRCS